MKRKLMLNSCFPASCLAVAAWLCPLSARGAEPPIRVDDIKGVYIEGAPGGVEAGARSALINGMRELYDVSLKGLDALPEEGAVIMLGGEAAVKHGLASENEFREITPGGYIIRIRGNKLAIAGANPYATGHGVNDFLEKIGKRVYSGGGGGTRSVIRTDKPKTRDLPAMDISAKPAVPYRIYVSRPEWAEADKALDALNPELAGKTDLWVDHSAGFLVPKDVYYDKHPEYYAMQADGKRIPKNAFSYHRTALCLSNPDVTRISIERMLKWVELQPDKIYFPVTYGDIGLWCQCEKCKALDPAPGENAARLLTWVNAVAGAVGEKHPDKIFMTFAYAGSDKAPAGIKPAKNVWVIASVGMGGNSFFDHCLATGRLKRDIDKLAGWLKIVPGQVAVCEYLSGVYMPALVDSTAGRMRWYAENGVRGVIFSFGNPVGFQPLWNYAYPRLMWDPNQDTKELARDFALNYYGPAGKDIADYLELVHDRYHETLKIPVDMPGKFYSKDFTEKAIAALKRARDAVKDDPSVHKEISDEMKMFVLDWMVNPASKEFDENAKTDLGRQLDSLLDLTETNEAARISFGREVHRTGLAAESSRKGALAVVESWLEEKNLPKPKGIPVQGGIQLPAEVFMYAGFGPALYHGGHVAAPCPEKMAVAVYVKGNSQNRSHRMVAEFELDKIEGDGSARLDIHGQDCDHDVDVAEIEALMNGTSIFKGPVTMVKWNWSQQSFDIPKGILKKGLNTLEVRNAADPAGVKNWHDRWFMLTDATVKFTGN